jgi:hypothetical protein
MCHIILQICAMEEFQVTRAIDTQHAEELQCDRRNHHQELRDCDSTTSSEALHLRD